MHDFDLFVIGAGSGGVRTARTAAALGARVAIAEERYFGGTCVNVGCIPKKLYGFAGDYASAFRDSAGFGWRVATPDFDWVTLRENKKKEISRLEDIYKNLLDKAGVRVFPQRASLLDGHTVQVGDEQVSAKHILLATGGWPKIPELPGHELAISSNEIFDLDSFPARLLIVGGGYIAVEFASIFSGLGSEVSLSFRAPTLLRNFDADISRHFTNELSRQVSLMPGSNVTGITRGKGGVLRVSFQDAGEGEFDTVLMATGRSANTAGLGLERTSVKLDDAGQVLVDKQFRTDEPSVYAIGDLVGRMGLTPVALAEGMLVADHLFGSGERRLSYDNIPTAVFAHPHIATVGMSEEQAREKLSSVVVYETGFRHLRHTLSGNPERTYMKIVVDGSNDRVVGMHMVGADAGEIIQGFAAAMVAGITKAQLDSTIGIHPSAAEEFVTMRVART